jgi:cellulose synthase/poly-beta-1,6-N-acetylglucosamine synthase-like glycosyltransferase
MRFLLAIPVAAASLYVIAVTAYLFMVAAAAYFFRKKAEYGGRPLRLAVVIPAHNEEAHIERTVECLHASIYPKGSYAVFVIADNCSDRTEELARRAGASVFRRTDPARRGKGQALDWFLRGQAAAYSTADAVVMIDADTEAHPDFLKEIAASLKHPGVHAAQGYYGVSNASAHWRSGLVSAAFHVFNHLRPAGHNCLGGTAGLRGNGMGFRKGLLRHGWPAYSIVEDYEFSVRLLLDGIVVHYNPDAMVFSDMPVERKVAETQRLRWEGASRGMRRTFIRLIFKRLIKEPRACYVDALANSFVPPLALLVLGQSVCLGAALALHSRLAVVLACCFAVDVFYVLSGLVLRRACAVEWRSLLWAPFYVLWKIPLYVKMRKADPNVWKRTKRPSELRGGQRS